MQPQDHEQFAHALLPETTVDEFSRQEFVKSYKLHLASQVSPNTKVVYDTQIKPAFEKEHGRPPKNRHEIRKAMNGNNHYQTWSSLLRTSQEMMWKSCQVPVARQLDKLVSVAKAPTSAGGTLTLNPDLEIPRYHTAVDIHCQPGGYHTEMVKDDVAAGAIYDRGVYIYAMGQLGPMNDDIGGSIIAYLKETRADFAPKRILDLGCSAAHSTVPYKLHYPDAEVCGVDVAAPMLRYAHARSESLGVPIHLSQQNAEDMNFEDGSFDLIVSHILVHETSSAAFRKIMKECHRLLAPGGIVIHAETPAYKAMDDFDAFILDWDTYNNNEPFWSKSHEIDPPSAAKEAGFDPAKSFEAMAPSAYEAAKAKRTNVFQGGDFGGGGFWYLYGVQK
ncbi:MAG: class I SAM-dependent methyltransferase [Rhodospirillaceae bacterium]|jgi:SAM-dependent methyltransferase|nr:class I SAM-dependent methyltransferase [Rhodospirillaceae bacterium]MBT5566794.1 class I SAM-dependent methyltransferase [Rhodospirillaceae bacterium]MBT5819045.1 class I SAM-dependent methyltransferase [Pseudomonadota bacterium]MBT6961896.1 class I SAM-dependent methyltransferase [Rhodospirillaceae bacterium]MBT7451967.1 class I SAM-dependent methyltransferase [Rhodospirillaceae bacterium]